MNKNAEIIFTQNLSHVIQPTRFPGVIYQGTVGLIRLSFETVVKNRKFWLHSVSNAGRLGPYSTRANYSGKAYWLNNMR